MRIALNLASRPFVELRPLFLRLRILSVLLVLLAVALYFALRSAQLKADEAQAEVHQWTQKTQSLEQEWRNDQALMQEPHNSATLDRSQFLNHEFRLKSFSWTTALMDLEKVLPQGVQVISIVPRAMKNGPVQVRLRINGPRDLIVQFVSNLEKSSDFLQPRVIGEAADLQGENHPGSQPTMTASTDVNVDIVAEFNPGNFASADLRAEQTKSGTHADSPATPPIHADSGPRHRAPSRAHIGGRP